MAIVDSLLNVLRTWRDAREQDRAQVVTYLRKISDASIQFRDSLSRVQRGEEANVWVLQEKATLIGQYYKNLSSVLGSKISSELLNRLAVYLARMYIADNRPVAYLIDDLDSPPSAEVNRYGNFTVTIEPNLLEEGHKVIVGIYGDSGPPTFADCLQELSTLSAQIDALADAIEAGADYR
jgi:hypothetical protein